jgi:hypothetical protein
MFNVCKLSAARPIENEQARRHLPSQHPTAQPVKGASSAVAPAASRLLITIPTSVVGAGQSDCEFDVVGIEAS